MIKIITRVENKNRWYDSDATVSLAVSLLRNADPEVQLLASKKIIEIAKSYNISVKEISSIIRTLRRRWYDNDDDISQAMECIKEASVDIQKKIALEIINFLCEMES